MPFTQEIFKKFKKEIEIIDPIIYKIVEKYGYLKPTPKRNLFALLIGSIIGQKIKFSIARKLRGKLYTKLGTDDFIPSDIDLIGKNELKKLGIYDFQYETIMRIVDYVVKNNIEIKIPKDLEKIRHIKGIGDWTINCSIIMYNLNADDGNFDDEVLYQDLIIRRGIKKLYGISKPSEITDLSEKWKPWRGLVTWYLWKEFT
jgi:DNA-3-methyladenine glycosylase II